MTESLRITKTKVGPLSQQKTDLCLRKIPEIIKENGDNCSFHIASSGEYGQKLIEKLQEEVDEYKKDFTLGELVDILEVIYALGDKEKIEKIRVEKFDKRGGFSKKIIFEDS